MSKAIHIEEITKYRESWLQAIWAHQLFEKTKLQSTQGEIIEIHFPGWLNKGAGPDFHDAKILIGNKEYLGAVEVHLQSSAWFTHKHHQNPVYNAVVLHVVLDHNTPHSIEREDQLTVAELELRPLLQQGNLVLLGDEQKLLEDYDHLPGRCGLVINDWKAETLKRLLGHAAENRMQQKMAQMTEQWHNQEPEQVLFQAMFKALGYSAYTHTFEELAQLYPLATITPLLQQPYRVARTAILSRWFGACGLFSGSSPRFSNPTLRKEFFQWQETWHALAGATQVSKKFKKPSRPQNAPERRLIGMFHHLYHLHSEGLLKGWLQRLKALEAIGAEKALKTQALQQTQSLFTTPDWEQWQSYLGLPTAKQSSLAQLIGKERQLILWANAILPFFLAYARQENWVALEKILYRLFLVLPPESSNYRTRFMEKRLLPFPPKALRPKTLRIQQGLIQIHQDFCQSFDQGCTQCQLLGLLEQLHQEAGQS